MIILHHLERSRSRRIAWMLEELGLQYELRRYARDPRTMLAPESLRAVHPLGKSPVLEDGEVVVAESGAILEYLVDRHGGGRFAPASGTPERTRYVYWMHFAEGSAMPYLVMSLVFDRIAKAPMPFFARPIARAIVGRVRAGFLEPNVGRILDYVEQELEGREWLCGREFSAADVQMSFPLEAAQARWPDGARPRIDAYLARLRARPAYQRAAERGGAFVPFG